MSLARIIRMSAIVVVAAWMFLGAAVMGAAWRSSSGFERSADRQAETRTPGARPDLERRRDTPQTSVAAVSRTLVCPTCEATLDHSDSPAADRMRAYVTAAVEAGWTDQEIRDALVQEYGGNESILAVPRAHGVGLLVWIVPGLVALAALIAGVIVVRRWRVRPKRRISSASSGSVAHVAESET